jgi:hypothetical protein
MSNEQRKKNKEQIVMSNEQRKTGELGKVSKRGTPALYYLLPANYYLFTA